MVNINWLQHSRNNEQIALSAVRMVMKREVNGSNPGGVKCFSTHMSFESNSSDISRFMFLIVTCLITPDRLCLFLIQLTLFSAMSDSLSGGESSVVNGLGLNNGQG